VLFAGAVAVSLGLVAVSVWPLEYRPFILADAQWHFTHAEFWRFRIASRSDFAANLVLGFGLGLAWCAAFVGVWSTRPLWRGVLLACLIWLWQPLAVEFSQYWCVDRIPASSDVYAQWIGGGVGMAVWLAAGRRIGQLTLTPEHQRR
jgi:hypothetical protein